MAALNGGGLGGERVFSASLAMSPQHFLNTFILYIYLKTKLYISERSHLL